LGRNLNPPIGSFRVLFLLLSVPVGHIFKYDKQRPNGGTQMTDRTQITSETTGITANITTLPSGRLLVWGTDPETGKPIPGARIGDDRKEADRIAAAIMEGA